jgi:hypothetical protein
MLIVEVSGDGVNASPGSRPPQGWCPGREATGRTTEDEHEAP